MAVMNKYFLVMYPGYGCMHIKHPRPEPRPVPLYGVVRALYSVPVK